MLSGEPVRAGLTGNKAETLPFQSEIVNTIYDPLANKITIIDTMQIHLTQEGIKKALC